jgi:hypothetical protein
MVVLRLIDLQLGLGLLVGDDVEHLALEPLHFDDHHFGIIVVVVEPGAALVGVADALPLDRLDGLVQLGADRPHRIERSNPFYSCFR